MLKKEFKIKDKVFRLLDLETEFNFGMCEKGETLYNNYNEALFNIQQENKSIYNIILENKVDILSDTNKDDTKLGQEIMKHMSIDEIMRFFKTQHKLKNNPNFVSEVMTLITTEKGVEPDIDNYDLYHDYWKKAPAMLNIEIVEGGFVDKFLDFFTKLITADLNTLQEVPETEANLKPKPTTNISKVKARS